MTETDTSKDRNVGKHIAVTNEENLQARKINVTRIKRIEVCHLLRIRNRILHKSTQDCEVSGESETAQLETVPLTEELMQTEDLKGARDFGTKDFVVLKDKGLVLATEDEFEELTELSAILEGKLERGTEAVLSLSLCDEI